MENKGIKIAQEYAQKLKDVKKDKEDWDSRYSYFLNCRNLRIRKALEGGLRISGDDEEKRQLYLREIARERAGLRLEIDRSIRMNQERFARKTSEIFKADNNRLGDGDDYQRAGTGQGSDGHGQQSAGQDEESAIRQCEVDGRFLGRPLWCAQQHHHLGHVGHLEHTVGDPRREGGARQ